MANQSLCCPTAFPSEELLEEIEDGEEEPADEQPPPVEETKKEEMYDQLQLLVQ